MRVAPPPQSVPHRLACYQCGDTGKMLATKLGEDALPYAFRCTCDRGKRIGVQFPRWTIFSEKTFKPLMGVQPYGGEARA